MNKASKRFLSLCMAAALVLGGLTPPIGMTAYADTAGSYGQPNDGIDFADLVHKDIYFGTYRHATAFSETQLGEYYGGGNNDLGITYDSEKRPILWRVMGEETNGTVTFLSEYALDGYYFHNDSRAATANQWEHSDLRNWLNISEYTGRTDDGNEEIFGFLHSNKSGFTDAELSEPVASTGVTTTTYGWDNESAGNKQNTADSFYIPWGICSNGSSPNNGKVSWSAEDALTDIDTIGDEDKVAKLKQGTPVYSWLRSPYSNYGSSALSVFTDGNVNNSIVASALGVRPAFQFNPSSVLFSSKIADGADTDKGETQEDDLNYFTGEDGRENYKLTILNTSLTSPTFAGLSDGNTVTVAPGGSMTLTNTAGITGKLVYKIVDRTTEKIVGYGIGDANDLIVKGTANVIGGANLTEGGDYTLYVWAQKDNEINSHEGSTPKYFNLKVEEAIGPGITPGGAGDANDGVDFDALMDGGIYYGTYKHAAELQNELYGEAIKWFDKDGVPTDDSSKAAAQPILWRVMGEEKGNGYLTLLSEYVLDGKVFREQDSESNANQWGASDLRKWLNDAFSEECFKTAELEGINPLEEISIKDSKGNDINVDVPNDLFYIPGYYGVQSINEVAWGVGNNSSTQLSPSIAYLKRGVNKVDWWLRSPMYDYQDSAMIVITDSFIYSADVNLAYGVRPAFQFNPSSVLFFSKIVKGAVTDIGETDADGTNYAAAGGVAENYKLTILGENDGAGVGTLTGVLEEKQTATENSDLTLSGLTSSQIGAAYTINYKIVGDDGSDGREIVSYGFGPATASTDLTLATSGLAVGDYDAYVWLQKNNDINSHEGTNPAHFALKVEPIPSGIIPGGAGDANDGIDFDALVGSGIYYGTYKHATAWEGNSWEGAADYEITATPILWRVMGEEADNGNLTLLSEYVLDGTPFRRGRSHVYDTSDIKNFLGRMDLFSGAEMPTKTTVVTTKMHNSSTGNEMTVGQGGITWPVSTVNQILYLPWGKYNDSTVYWDVDNLEQADYKLASSYDGNKATLKSGTSVYWWLRAPLSTFYNYALYVNDGGSVNDGDVTDALGVRPAFQFNPSSVLFSSKIVSGSEDGMGTINEVANNYAAAGGVAENYKLTILGENDGADVGTLGNVPITDQTVTKGDNLPLSGLTSSQTSTDYTINYKIVGDDGSDGREIVSYGFGPATASTDLTLATSGLAVGDYDAYVWLQKNNDINSHEGTNPAHFALEVTNATVPSTPLNLVATPGDAEITIAWAAPTSNGGAAIIGYEVQLDSGSWNTATGLTHTFTGLTNGTPYTLSVRAVNSVGKGTEAMTTATPIAAATVPGVPLNLVATPGDAEITITWAAPESNGGETITDYEVQLDSGSWSVATGLTHTFTGLTNGTSYTLSVRAVNIVGKGTEATTTATPIAAAHTLTVSAETGGNVSGDSSGSYTVDASISVTATANSGYSFSGWTADGITVSNTQTISFNMPNKDVTLTANFTYNGGSSTPDTPKTTIDDKQPNVPTVAKQKVSGTVRDTVLTLHITEKMAKAAITAAEKAVKVSGETADGIAVAFIASNPGRYESLVALIEPGAIERLKEADVKYVKIGSAIIDITLDAKAITEIDKQTTGDVTVSAMKQEKLSEAAKALIGSRPAFDITIKDSKGAVVSDLKGGKATIGITYKAADAEKTGSLLAVYVDKNGKPTLLANSLYDNGRLVFERGSLSTYGVGYKITPVFTDTENHWAKDDIDFIVSRGIIDGTTATTFAPDKAITRADFLMALGKLSGADVSGYTASSFIDVTDTDPAMPYIEWALKQGIVQGFGDNKFGPALTITRQDMAVMMWNYAKVTGYTLPVSRTVVTFADAARISAYAKDAVTAMEQAGIIVGKPGNLFDPHGTATRAEASTILHRFVELVVDEAVAMGRHENNSGQ